MIRMLADHLWQSTIFVALAALLAQLLRHERAQVRYWVWLSASLKFLTPFAAVMAMGRLITWRLPAAASFQTVSIIQRVTEPYSQADVNAAVNLATSDAWRMDLVMPIVLLAWAIGTAVCLAAWFLKWRELARIARLALPMTTGREVASLRRLELSRGIRSPIPVLACDGRLEPGVFGVFRPVLLWPVALSQHLDDEQVEAIVAHEVCHIGRRDNVTAVVHLLVQAIFWFYPLVWWIGARLIEERERACDQEVMSLGSAPQVYAQGILKTCEACVESPLICAAGVTGSDLKKRIVEIMCGEAVRPLRGSVKMLLGAAAGLSMGLPLAIGLITAPRLRAQIPAVDANGPRFEVASIKPNTSLGGPTMMQIQPGRMTLTNVTVRLMLRNSYHIQEFQMSGGPAWLDAEHFDVIAKAEGNPTQDEFGAMLRALLADRFKLVVHRESREMPVYSLVTTPSASTKLRKSELDCFSGTGAPQAAPTPAEARCGFRMSAGTMSATGATMATLASSLSTRVSRIVVDHTGLPGGFDFDLSWTPDQRPAGGPEASTIDPNGASLFTAVQEQLGLKLEPAKAPVEVLVIDQVQRPTVD
jgi:bla regulator protein BlaR1